MLMSFVNLRTKCHKKEFIKLIFIKIFNKLIIKWKQQKQNTWVISGLK